MAARRAGRSLLYIALLNAALPIEMLEGGGRDFRSQVSQPFVCEVRKDVYPESLVFTNELWYSDEVAFPVTRSSLQGCLSDRSDFVTTDRCVRVAVSAMSTSAPSVPPATPSSAAVSSEDSSQGERSGLST